MLRQAKLRDVALSRGDREAAVAIMAGRMGFYAVRAPTRLLPEERNRGDIGCCPLAVEASLPHGGTQRDADASESVPEQRRDRAVTPDAGLAAQVPFEDVPDLVATRRVLLVKGQAYVQQDQVGHLQPPSRRSSL